MKARIAARLILVATLVSAVFVAWPEPPVSGQPAPGTDAPGARTMGVATCSSMACHHGNGAKGAKGSEYTTWAGYDRHARAFTVLYNERSQRMVRNLYGSEAKPATETTLCLKCHATGNGDTSNVGARFSLADGVGCESCHGPAEKWLSEHYKPEFVRLSAEEKVKSGLWNTKDLTFRAKLCTECHVGDANKDVNHDLIAAGHPRLNFELAGYHGIYAKHWAPEKNEVKLWSIGQIISARASLELLRARATDPNKPWPEFSESNCFACHKDLTVDSPRQQTWKPGDNPGALPWGTWYMTMTKQYAQMADAGQAKQLDAALEQIRKRMQSPSPDGKGVAAEAAKAIQLLDEWLAREQKRTYTKEGVKKDLQTLLQIDAKDADALDWDRATQLYLALAALHVGLKELDGQPKDAPAFSKELKALGGRLRSAFPNGYDSPRDFNPLRPPLSETLNSLRRELGN